MQAETSVRFVIWKVPATVGEIVTVAGEAWLVKTKLSVPLDKVKSIGPVPVVSVTVKSVVPAGQIEGEEGVESVAIGAEETATGCPPKGPAAAQLSASTMLMT